MTGTAAWWELFYLFFAGRRVVYILGAETVEDLFTFSHPMYLILFLPLENKKSETQNCCDVMCDHQLIVIVFIM